MGQTPNFQLPYPELTDPADVPLDMKELAEAIDTKFGGGSSAGSTLVFASVQDVGNPNQIRAGRQLAVRDFTDLGLAQPIGLFNLGGLTNLGSAGPLVDKGTVPYSAGVNGIAGTAAQFAGSSAQALYVVDTGAADPFRIKTGSWGCWFRTAKRGTGQTCMSKTGQTAGAFGTAIYVAGASNSLVVQVSLTGSDAPLTTGISDVADDRWHFGVFTHDGTSTRLYVDGVLEAVSTVSGGLFGSAGPLNIGGQSADGATVATAPHFGRVDEAFVTSDVLSDDQVRNLYCASLPHTLAAVPNKVDLNVRRGRRGGPLLATDFPNPPVRLHNLTGGALTDAGSGNVPLSNVGAAVSVAGADGQTAGAYSFMAASSQSLAATDTGLPAASTARSYGCWFKTTAAGSGIVVMGWGTVATADVIWLNSGVIHADNGADGITGPFVADGQWHHAIVIEDNAAADGVKRKLYLDGRLVGGSTVLNGIVLGGANFFRVGANPAGSSPFTGQIDSAFICAYALTGDQVRALYNRASQPMLQSPKNAGDHVETVDSQRLLATFDTLSGADQINLGVAT